jgi:hypothetical protein
MPSLRKIIAHPAWWVAVVVTWVVWLTGPDTVSWGAVGVITLLLTGFVVLAKAVERLTRPAQTAQQVSKMHKKGK